MASTRHQGSSGPISGSYSSGASSISGVAGNSKFANSNLNSMYQKPGSSTRQPAAIGGPRMGSMTLLGGGGPKVQPQNRARAAPGGGKLAVPKPVNLPSIKKEHAGNDPTTQLVPAGGSVGGWKTDDIQPTKGVHVAVPGSSTPQPGPAKPGDRPLVAGSTWGSALSGHGPTPSEATSVVPFASYGPASRSFPVRQEPQGRLNPQEYPSLGTALLHSKMSDIPKPSQRDERRWDDDERDTGGVPGVPESESILRASQVASSGSLRPDWSHAHTSGTRGPVDRDDERYTGRPVGGLGYQDRHYGRDGLDDRGIPRFGPQFGARHVAVDNFGPSALLGDNAPYQRKVPVVNEDFIGGSREQFGRSALIDDYAFDSIRPSVGTGMDAKPRPVERDPERERYDAEVERELRQQEAEREERRLAGERVKNGDSDESPPPLPAQPPPVSASVHPNPNSRLRMGPAYKAEEDTSKPKLIPYSNAAQAAGGASGHGAQPTKGVSTLAPTPAQAHAQAQQHVLAQERAALAQQAAQKAASAQQVPHTAPALAPSSQAPVSSMPSAIPDPTPDSTPGKPDDSKDASEGDKERKGQDNEDEQGAGMVNGKPVIGKLVPRSERAEAERKALEDAEIERKTKAAQKLKELEDRIARKREAEERAQEELKQQEVQAKAKTMADQPNVVPSMGSSALMDGPPGEATSAQTQEFGQPTGAGREPATTISSESTEAEADDQQAVSELKEAENKEPVASSGNTSGGTAWRQQVHMESGQEQQQPQQQQGAGGMMSQQLGGAPPGMSALPMTSGGYNTGGGVHLGPPHGGTFLGGGKPSGMPTMMWPDSGMFGGFPGMMSVSPMGMPAMMGHMPMATSGMPAGQFMGGMAFSGPEAAAVAAQQHAHAVHHAAAQAHAQHVAEEEAAMASAEHMGDGDDNSAGRRGGMGGSSEPTAKEAESQGRRSAEMSDQSGTEPVRGALRPQEDVSKVVGGGVQEKLVGGRGKAPPGMGGPGPARGGGRGGQLGGRGGVNVSAAGQAGVNAPESKRLYRKGSEDSAAEENKGSAGSLGFDYDAHLGKEDFIEVSRTKKSAHAVSEKRETSRHAFAAGDSDCDKSGSVDTSTGGNRARIRKPSHGSAGESLDIHNGGAKGADSGDAPLAGGAPAESSDPGGGGMRAASPLLDSASVWAGGASVASSGIGVWDDSPKVADLLPATLEASPLEKEKSGAMGGGEGRRSQGGGAGEGQSASSLIHGQEMLEESMFPPSQFHRVGVSLDQEGVDALGMALPTDLSLAGMQQQANVSQGQSSERPGSAGSSGGKTGAHSSANAAAPNTAASQNLQQTGMSRAPQAHHPPVPIFSQPFMQLPGFPLGAYVQQQQQEGSSAAASMASSGLGDSQMMHNQATQQQRWMQSMNINTSAGPVGNAPESSSFYGNFPSAVGPFGVGSSMAQAQHGQYLQAAFAPVSGPFVQQSYANQFAQLGLGVGNPTVATYLPTGKQPDWKHTPATSGGGSAQDSYNLMHGGDQDQAAAQAQAVAQAQAQRQWGNPFAVGMAPPVPPGMPPGLGGGGAPLGYGIGHGDNFMLNPHTTGHMHMSSYGPGQNPPLPSTPPPGARVGSAANVQELPEFPQELGGSGGSSDGHAHSGMMGGPAQTGHMPPGMGGPVHSHGGGPHRGRGKPRGGHRGGRGGGSGRGGGLANASEGGRGGGGGRRGGGMHRGGGAGGDSGSNRMGRQAYVQRKNAGGMPTSADN
mmetsp:Transcript_7471/g.14144  ORF Transcript_7471/g.14144 Transcript_7471/m.14144 type:complete len:1731 (-) Transcript_7471:1130-6322(-)